MLIETLDLNIRSNIFFLISLKSKKNYTVIKYFSMQETQRQFGPDDLVSLKDIAQGGASGIVTVLHQLSAGVIWLISNDKKFTVIVQ